MTCGTCCAQLLWAWGFKKWEPSVDLPGGAQVKFDGKLYRSSRAVDGTTTPPTAIRAGFSSKAGAQASSKDLRDFAQMLSEDRDRWQATAVDTLDRIGPHLEEVAGRGLTRNAWSPA